MSSGDSKISEFNKYQKSDRAPFLSNFYRKLSNFYLCRSWMYNEKDWWLQK